MVKKKKGQFNKIEQKILRVLYQQKVYLSVYEVAKACGISYPTAKKYLYSLAKKGYIRTRGK